MYKARSRPPQSIRITLREPLTEEDSSAVIAFTSSGNTSGTTPPRWLSLSDEQRLKLHDLAIQRFQEPVYPTPITVKGKKWDVDISINEIAWPYRPVRGHWLGIDGSGRDVLARLLYGLRISMTFGFALVILSMIIGITIGAIQGYFGGIIDIAGQRLIEIWGAIPFLYVMILLGSVYGQHLGLLLFCYGIFNWIGISYYMRAEFLRLRGQVYVDAARCLGVRAPGIMIRHILPNAITPIITFFPFSLVGAIGSLAALDYLGFGLPPPTPSWGELLQQAQRFREAWWLILYPSLALFVVMLLGVFIGEGVREAFDPRKYSRLQ
jgi:microcin C transport system permease protein